MKLALVHSKDDYKLSPKSYSKNYWDLFNHLERVFSLNRWDVVHITESGKTDADVVVYFDPHSSHSITVDGGKLRYEYMNDPHQKDFSGQYVNGPKFTKLGAANRSKRALDRGIHWIICPTKAGYNQYLKPYLGDRLVWFPICPARPTLQIPPLDRRVPMVLGNGHLWAGENGFRPYEFRRWAYAQPEITHIPHVGQNRNVPVREEYIRMLTLFAGALSLCDVYVVAKYFENCLCGCLNFIQALPECEELGFADGENCICVTKENFKEKVTVFKENPASYQKIADAGRKLCQDRWTASAFGNFIYNHAKERL